MLRKTVISEAIRATFGRRIIFLLTICLTLSVAAAGWGIVINRKASRSRQAEAIPPGLSSNAQSLSPDTPSKEYIYAGARLIAIEERNGGSGGLVAPGNLRANGGAGAQITIQWIAVGSAHHYQIERADAAGNFVTISGDVTSNSFTDNVSPDTAYLYQVRAVDAAGNLSPPSNVDLATSVVFTDDPLRGQQTSQTGTIIRAAHLSELRRAVNAVRALVGQPPISWQHPDPVSNPPEQQRTIYRADVVELRSGLDEALSVLGMQRPYETDPNLTADTAVKAAHFQELRERVK